MSIAIAALTAVEETVVHEADCIETSFPDFYSKLLQLTAASLTS
jgi:5-enolpyruvylshikimate-3-phosphate synthase